MSISKSEKSTITEKMRICHQGEGFFLSLLSKFAILHKVEGGNDIGIDYFCEWINQEKSESSNVLFAIQLKTTRQSKIIFKNKSINKRLNGLGQYEIKRKNKKGYSCGNYDNNNLIKGKTIKYWQGFEIPVYLFVAVLGNKENKLFYKRYTPILHETQKRNNEKFNLVSRKNLFLAFANNKNEGGFCRDLFIDYMRCNYKKGSIAYKNPRDLGLYQFPEEESFFKDLITKEYNEEIQNTIVRFKELKIRIFTNQKNKTIDRKKNRGLPSATSTSSCSDTVTKLIDK